MGRLSAPLPMPRSPYSLRLDGRKGEGMKGTAKIKIGENHRRTISTVLSLLDQMLCEFDRIASGAESTSVMYREKNSLSPAQRTRLRAATTEIRNNILRIKETLSLEPETVDLAKRIWSQSSSFWEVLVETRSGHLRGYGEVPPSLTAFLDPRIDELIEQLTGIPRILRR